jgi:hypothetical protein
MTKDESIVEACRIVALAYHSIGDFTQPSDGFCRKCPAPTSPGWHYSNAGQALAYVRRAVVAQLQRDGFAIAPFYDLANDTWKE